MIPDDARMFGKDGQFKSDKLIITNIVDFECMKCVKRQLNVLIM